MDLSDDAKIMLGAFCEDVMRDDRFNAITNMYETSTVQQLLSTKPQDRGRRDELFFSIRGVRDLLTLMAQLAAEKGRLLDPTQNSKQPSNDDDFDIDLMSDLPPEDAEI